jgi:short-subunit dehydrogenase
MESFAPTHVILCAGGGVHGVYESKPWHSHEWTLQLNLIFPMKLAHFCLNHLTQLEQLIFVGSSIAESAPDPLASSYCASKHGLLGFATTLIKEDKGIDIRLMSPPYMETDLLPEGSWPRREGLAQKPEEVARKFVRHMMDKSQKNTHITL